MTSVWIQYTDFTGNTSDFSVTDFTAAHSEASRIINYHKMWVADEVMRSAIILLLKTSEWEIAVTLYNRNNSGKEKILFRHGNPVDSPSPYEFKEPVRKVSKYDFDGTWVESTEFICHPNLFRDLFDAQNDFDMKYVYQIDKTEQKKFFTELGVVFDDKHVYYIECE